MKHLLYCPKLSDQDIHISDYIDVGQENTKNQNNSDEIIRTQGWDFLMAQQYKMMDKYQHSIC